MLSFVVDKNPDDVLHGPTTAVVDPKPDDMLPGPTTAVVDPKTDDVLPGPTTTVADVSLFVVDDVEKNNDDGRQGVD